MAKLRNVPVVVMAHTQGFMMFLLQYEFLISYLESKQGYLSGRGSKKSQGGDHDHVIEVQSFFMSIEHATHVKWQDLGCTIAEVVLTIFTPVDNPTSRALKSLSKWH